MSSDVDFLSETLAGIEALWEAMLAGGFSVAPTVFLNVAGESESQLIPDGVAPQNVPNHIAGVVRSTGAKELVFTAPWKPAGMFGRQSVMATHMTPEGVRTFTARLQRKGLGQWEHVPDATAPFPAIQAALEETSSK